MQTLKIFLVTVAATALTCVGQVAPKETEAQAKAREALRQKMEQLGGQPAPVAPTAPAPPVKPSAPAPAPAPVRVTPPPVVQAPPAAPADPSILSPQEEDEATIRARAALREKMDALKQPTAGKKPRSGATAGAAVSTDSFAPVPPPSQPGAAEKAIQAKMEKLATPVVPDATPVVASPPPAPKPAPVAPPKPKPAKPVKAPAEVAAPVAKTTPVSPPPSVEEPKSEPAKPAKAKPAKDAVRASGYPPLDPPPSALPPSKETRLAELLRQYRADEISPAAYHAERARILATP